MNVWFGKRRSSNNKSFRLQDKVAIVTGASSGIGETLAKALVSKGCTVVLAARRQHELERVAKSLPIGTYFIVPTDVTVEHDCQRLIEQTMTKFGRIDVLINNAGITKIQRFDNRNISDNNTVNNNLDSSYRNVMDVNYFGTLYCTYYALPYLKQQRQRHHETQTSEDGTMIVAISSGCGKMGIPTRSAYCASKHAIHGFLDSLRIELQYHNNNDNNNNNNNSSKHSVHILLACPGAVQTGIRTKSYDNNNNNAVAAHVNQMKNVMSKEQCVDQIINAMENKDREVYIVSSIWSKVLIYLRPILPEYVDRWIIRKILQVKSSSVQHNKKLT